MTTEPERGDMSENAEFSPAQSAASCTDLPSAASETGRDTGQGPREVHRGAWFDLNGYKACSVKYEDGSWRVVLEHREIMERHLGRRLHRLEHVHHGSSEKSTRGGAE